MKTFKDFLAAETIDEVANSSANDTPEITKTKAAIKAARLGMYKAGKNKAEYERHEMAFNDAIENLEKHKNKS